MGKSESQMDIMEKSSKPGKRRWTVAEIGLSVLLLLVSCALAGLVVLYTSAVKEQYNKTSVSGSSTSEGQLFRSSHNSVCTTADCVTAAARLLQNMDKSVKPCDNFYQYACGGWLERHVIPETSSRHSVFDILRDKLEIVLKGVLETQNEQDRNAIKKAKVLYNSCMNESLIEQRDSQPLLQLIESIGDWPVASDDWNTTTEEAWSLEDTLAKLTARFHKKVLLDMYVWTDDRDSRRHIIYIDQPGLGMPSRDYYFNDGNYKKVREAYLHFMVSIAKITREDRNLTQDDDRVWEEMMQVLELETDIANATSPAEERQDVTVLYNKMTLGELQSTFNFNGYNWTRFIQGCCPACPLRCSAMAIKEHIGYPDHILQEGNQKLDQEYAHLNFSEEHYFENILENLKSEAHKSLKKLREPVDPDLWIIGAAVVNAFYSPNRNQIVFPAGILQPPFFSKHQHQALNFGGIGMVIGHEITHGFDDNGRNFDKDGNMLNWWSNYSAEHFKEQSQCMVQQYGNFNWKLAGGQNVSGISTLGENIADNGGVHQAYKAYLKWVEMEGEEPRLPGLDMDYKQLFFLNFAQVWCGAYRPEYASQSIKTDSHSPLEYRVLGSLQNFEAFSEAFQCQKGSRMNPELKCRVW
ncbi:membrane metallo-endopeptidase-like 1 [Etheostoma spectabile]|uniref:membrane metallo-endopeptidase-like 1 n=1 Tax=Etheostoma spectabile TaxID=54343 RepID=UPI0013AFACC8|nr:membrane metallo-endopeptidase-like 1 [Etheostoma spectabile]